MTSPHLFPAVPSPLRLRTLCRLLVILAVLACAPQPAPAAESGPGPSLETMAGQMLMAGFRGDVFTRNMPIAQDIASGRLGGVVLFDRDLITKGARNVQSPEQVRSLVADLQRHAPVPLLVAIDQEGGRVARLKPAYGFPATQSAEELGRGTPSATRRAGAAIGRTLAGLGIGLDFAPVVDVNTNADNPVIGRLARSFSPDPEAVAAHAAAFIEGLGEHHVLSCLKHFPGHGSAWNDSHHGMADVTETWDGKELVPYERLIRAGLAEVVMTGHLMNRHLDPEHPATLSRPTLTGLLREQLGFTGVIVSDDMQMRAVADHYGLERAIELAVNAGVDILLFGNNLDYDPDLPQKAHAILVRLVRQDRIPLSRIEESHARIMRLKAR